VASTTDNRSRDLPEQRVYYIGVYLLMPVVDRNNRSPKHGNKKIDRPGGT